MHKGKHNRKITCEPVLSKYWSYDICLWNFFLARVFYFKCWKYHTNLYSMEENPNKKVPLPSRKTAI